MNNEIKEVFENSDQKKDKYRKTNSSNDKKKKRFQRRLRELIIKTAVLIIGIVLLTTVFFSIHVVHGNDMYPSIRDGDLVITYRLVNTYMSDHVFAYKHDGTTYFGRIVGVAGDTIEFDGKGFYRINGNNPYEDHFYDTNPSNANVIDYPYVVAEDSVFILGDYRLQTEDSRSFGSIPTRDLIGEVVLILRRRGF